MSWAGGGRLKAGTESGGGWQELLRTAASKLWKNSRNKVNINHKHSTPNRKVQT